MERDRLFRHFESLGDSCEFGLVQRWADAEPLGLLRFAGFSGALEHRLEDLVAALDRDFVGLGGPGTVEVTIEGDADRQEYIVRETAYGLTHHTFRNPSDVAVAEITERETKNLGFLRRKLLADLTSAEKIFVWKSNLPIELSRVQRLLAALRRHGPAKLLWVCATDGASDRVGTVERLADGLLRGSIDRFGTYDKMVGINHEAWFAICTAALRLVGSPATQADANRTIPLVSLRDLAARAQLDPSVGGIREIGVLAPRGEYTRVRPVLQDVAGLDANQQDAHRDLYANPRQDFDEILQVVLDAALVTGHGAIITRDGHLLSESCWECLASNLLPHGLRDIGDRRFRLEVAPTRTVHGPALLLKRPWWRNYRHWLVDTASLLAFASDHLDIPKLQLVVGREDDPSLRKAMHDLLAMLAPGVPIIEHPDDEVWRFADLHYITPVYSPPVFLLPEALSALRAHTRAKTGEADAAAGKPRRRLYVWHGVVERPRLDNEAEIIKLCAEFGFEAVTPDALSMADRIAMFGDAEVVIGVKSPELANIVFCQPSTLVVVLSPGDWPDPFHAELAGGSGLRYAEMFGEVIEARREVTPNDFRIEPSRLRRALVTLLPGAAPEALSASAAAASVSAPLRPSPPIVDFAALLPAVFYPDHQGEIYLAVLRHLHDTLRPRTYLEIGTQNGEALALAACKAIAIDPWMLPDTATLGERPGLSLFEMSSDAFFARHDPANYLDGPVELAFLDGPKLHFDIILRDFINVERHATTQSVVLIHDVVPPDIYMASRDRLDDFRRSRSSHPMWWTGDVWKVIGVLQKYRPDLTIDIFDASPSGLAMVRGLDPASRTLSARYPHILREIAAWPNEEAAFVAYRAGLRLRSTADLPGIVAQWAPHTGSGAL